MPPQRPPRSVNEEVDGGQSPQAVQLVEQVSTAQEAEIAEMQQMLETTSDRVHRPVSIGSARAAVGPGASVGPPTDSG
ncbi:DUF305 domain-containing protein [Citricoccus nitrophenolicus]